MLPTNPMDLPTTQRLLEEHIAAGDITQADVDLLKRGYRSMATTTFLGSLVGIPVYIVMSRRRPPPSLLTRLVAASFMASTGSFLGFTIGGAAAAMEVSQHMEDSQRCVFPPTLTSKTLLIVFSLSSKLHVFEDIMVTSKRIAATQGQFGPTVAADWGGATASTESSPVTESKMSDDLQGSGDVWDAEASERRIEEERERGVVGATGGIAAQTGSTWDRLRQQSSARPSAQSTQSSTETTSTRAQPPVKPSNPLDLTTSSSSKYPPGLSVEEKIEMEAAEERRREQEEFERLVEREREAARVGREVEMGKW
jgi:hypothetical protein